MLEKRKNLAWLILTRLIVVSLFLASITYFNVRQPDLFPNVMLRDVTRLITVTYFFSILSLVSIRFYPSIILPLGYAQIVWETLFVSILVVILVTLVLLTALPFRSYNSITLPAASL